MEKSQYYRQLPFRIRHIGIFTQDVYKRQKPYSGVNGSGKHNNWSLCTDTGINLFAPGKNPKGNMLRCV